jgi:hypothetical protein
MGASRIFVGILAIGLAASCGSSDSTDDAAAPTPQSSTPGLVEPTCMAGNLLGFSGLPQDAPPVPDPMPIPEGFVPVRAVICEGDWNAGVADDHTVAWIEERREGDMTAVLAGYALPSYPPPEELTCLADQPTPPIVWLVDERGLGLRAPGLPTGECGVFKWDAITALRALPVTDRIVHRIPVSEATESLFRDEPS